MKSDESISLLCSPFVRNSFVSRRACRDIFVTAAPERDWQIKTRSSFFRKGSPPTVVDVKDVHDRIALIDRVNDSVGGLFLAKKQMAKCLTLRNNCPALTISL